MVLCVQSTKRFWHNRDLELGWEHLGACQAPHCRTGDCCCWRPRKGRETLLGLAGAVGVQQLLQGAGQVPQHAGCALKFLVQHAVGLPVHCAAQVVRQLEGILQPKATMS